MSKRNSTQIETLADKILSMKNPVVMTDEFWTDIQTLVASSLPIKPIEQSTPTDLNSIWHFETETEPKPEFTGFWNKIIRALNR